MSNLARTLLIAAIIFCFGAAFVTAYAPSNMTTQNEAAGAFIALCLSAVLVRRRSVKPEAQQESFRADVGASAAPGRDYEQTCRQTLKSLGWEIVHTPGSRDRGADLYAMKKGVRLLVQCKQYKNAVSYRAVSEVLAARSFYPADHLCVVAPGDFTRDAKAAARDAGVQLLHHDELHRYAKALT